jgi:tRNA threonylcarbamoyladenosine biosynthesis protein TsaE
MTSNPLRFDWQTAEDTAKFATDLGAQLGSGDVILLSGPVGAGKTHFARALIQSILDVPEEVPSPTFTLVQTYDTQRGPLWHADLYRISTDTEIDELGLYEAFETAICLVEWPDRLGVLAPQNALTIDILPEGETRHVRLDWSAKRWDQLEFGRLQYG